LGDQRIFGVWGGYLNSVVLQIPISFNRIIQTKSSIKMLSSASLKMFWKAFFCAKEPFQDEKVHLLLSEFYYRQFL